MDLHRARFALLALGVAALAAGALRLGPEGLLELLQWVRSSGVKGWLSFTIAYLAYALLALPASWAQAMAGLLFGPWAGFLYAALLGPLGSTLAFGLTRSALRRPVGDLLARHPRFRLLDRAAETKGLTLVLLLRLPPVSPYNLVSYALGATRVRWSSFVLGTTLGGLPAAWLYTRLGAEMGDVERLLLGGPPRPPDGFALVGTALTVAVVLLLGVWARRALSALEAERS
jgi:uncharacterized membrane protein YdjX (TVP38/TMEM64 family)